jgi:hypothetical protein
MAEDLEDSRTVWIRDIALGAIVTSIFLTAWALLALSC